MLEPVDNEPMDFEAWLRIGFDNGWAGPPVCETHDGVPMSTDEDAEFSDGGDPCIHIIRLYDDAEHKDNIEKNHSASVWRASNRGMTP
jgi:hypothetical protein